MACGLSAFWFAKHFITPALDDKSFEVEGGGSFVSVLARTSCARFDRGSTTVSKQNRHRLRNREGHPPRQHSRGHVEQQCCSLCMALLKPFCTPGLIACVQAKAVRRRSWATWKHLSNFTCSVQVQHFGLPCCSCLSTCLSTSARCRVPRQKTSTCLLSKTSK